MNKQIEALKMAIKGLEEGFGTLECEGMLPHRYQETTQACKEALAEAENPELVAVQYLYKFDKDNPEMIPLYSHPATWQSLSEQEIKDVLQSVGWIFPESIKTTDSDYSLRGVLEAYQKVAGAIRAIEAKLKEKNRGRL